MPCRFFCAFLCGCSISTNFNSKVPSNTALKGITGVTERKWYYKNPDTKLGYQTAATSSSKGNTIVKNQHQYYYKNGSGNYFSGTRSFYSQQFSIDEQYYMDYGIRLIQNSNPSWESEKVFSSQGYRAYGYMSTSQFDDVYITFTSNINNEKEVHEDIVTFFVLPVLNDSTYSSAVTSTRTEVKKTVSDYYGVNSTTSDTTKKYVTDETAAITQLNLQGAMFPHLTAQYDSTTAKQYTLNSSLTSNGLTASSNIPYKNYEYSVKYSRGARVSTNSYYFKKGYKIGNSATGFNIKETNTVTENIATTTPANMISQTTTAATYADGNGSQLQNGIYYNANGGYAKNKIYVQTGSGVPSNLEFSGNTAYVRPEFVLLEHPQRKAQKNRKYTMVQPVFFDVSFTHPCRMRRNDLCCCRW